MNKRKFSDEERKERKRLASKKYRELHEDYGKEYWKNNKKSRNDYYQKNKEKFKKLNNDYYKDNKEYVKEMTKAYYDKNIVSIKAYRKQWYEENKDEHRNRKLMSKYGISLEEYNSKLKSQNNACAICGKLATDENRAFCVDHNHKTGKVRKLLCTHCNFLIGYSYENPEILRNAAKYIEEENED